ncbi:MAG: hypothetical protein MSS70_06160, partial [Christensenellaceae bacterium]|nr:hypothetical protein [Christensenellaceae bacterium]
ANHLGADAPLSRTSTHASLFRRSAPHESPLPTRKTVRKVRFFFMYYGGFSVVKTTHAGNPAQTTEVLTLRFTRASTHASLFRRSAPHESPLPTRKTVRKRAVFLLYFGGFGVVKTQRTREIPREPPWC